MTGIKDKFLSPSFSDNIHPLNIIDGTSFTLHGKRVHAIASLSLDDVLFVLKFPVSLLANLLNKINVVQYFTSHIVCFRICILG